MRALVRLFAFALTCVAVLVGAAWALARWQGEAVASLDLPGAGHSLMSELQTGDALDAQDQPTRERLLGKQEVVNALLDGRISLREAGYEFRRMNEEKAEGDAAAQGASTSRVVISDEAVYENLMAWVNSSASAKPDWAASAARLRGEADSLLHRRLPGL